MTTDGRFEKWWDSDPNCRPVLPKLSLYTGAFVKGRARAAYHAASADADRLRDLVRRLQDGLRKERSAPFDHLESRDEKAEAEALLAEADEELKNA